MIGQLAPNFTLPNVHGMEISLSSMRGHNIVLAFFCGCDRCHAAARKIGQLQAAGKLKNFVAVVALDLGEIKQFQKDTGIHGILLSDPSDKISEEYSSEFCPRLWAVSGDRHVTYASDIALEGQPLNQALRDIVSY